MDLVTIDFETYYARDFTLSGMTTEAYLRDPRFHVIGVALKMHDADKPTFYSGDAVPAVLEQANLQDKAVLAHNAVFDAAILNWHYGIKPAFLFDTLSMSRALNGPTSRNSLKMLAQRYKLGEKGQAVHNYIGKRLQDFTAHELYDYGLYCVNDVELTYHLFRVMSQGFPYEELYLIDQTLRMFTEPVLLLDKQVLFDHHAELVAEKEALLAEVVSVPNVDFEHIKKHLMSNQKFADTLRQHGVEPPKKLNAKGNLTYAFAKTDEGFIDLLEHPNQKIQTLASARVGVKSTIQETRTKRFIDIQTRGTLPAMLNYYGAHTGRYSGGDKINLQNLPRGGVLRKAIVPPAGYQIISCDLSQIEARVLAYIAGQEDLVQAFREGRDVYCEFASIVFGRTITKDDARERFLGKTMVLSLGYQQGPVSFHTKLNTGAMGMVVEVDENEVKRYVNTYRQTYNQIKQFWYACQNSLPFMSTGQHGHIAPLVPYEGSNIRLPNGLLIQYPGLHDTAEGYKYLGYGASTNKIYGGKMTENIVQALARIVVTDHARVIGERYKVALQVHDEIVIVCPEAEVAEAKTYIEAVMSRPPEWAPELPLACEIGSGYNFLETK